MKAKNRRLHTIEDGFYVTGLCLPVLGLLGMPFLGRWLRLPCLFHLLTGFYCPGCGGTRAVRELLHGHLLRSVYYHPVVLYGTILYLYFMISQTIERMTNRKVKIGLEYKDGFAWIGFAMVLLNFLIKNMLHYVTGFVL